MRTILLYSLTAFGMGVLWYAVLFPFGQAVPFGGEVWFINLLAMCLASLTVALLFRPLILRAKGLMFHVLAMGLPTVGSFLFGSYMVLGWYLYDLTRPNVGFHFHEVIQLPLLFVLFGAWRLFFITIPMGYLSEWLLQLVVKQFSKLSVVVIAGV